MKHRLLICLLALLPVLASYAQNNPFEISDECYSLYTDAEEAIGKPYFDFSNARLLRKARELDDTKAETLHYVLALKSKTSNPKSDENDMDVDRAAETLREIAQKNHYRQYYYYSYQLSQNYYYNTGRHQKALSMLEEMQAHALADKDEYGRWTSDKYIAQIYIAQADFVSAKPHIETAIRIWNTTADPIIRRQPVSRLYCDLADTYPIGADSVYLNVAKAYSLAKVHMDTLRCEYYMSRLSAVSLDRKGYRQHRDYCITDPKIGSISPTATKMFALIDSAFDGRIEADLDDVLSLKIRETKVVANLCENLGFKDFAFDIEKRIVVQQDQNLANLNHSKISELDVTMGKAALSADLATKDIKISHLTMFMTIILVVVLAGMIIFGFVYIRSLSRSRARDQHFIKELQEANEQVRIANESKTRFIQNMSHEVRTPLNAIVGFSQLLGLPDGMLQDEEKEEFSGYVVNNAQMLTMLLDDILNASAMDNGEYKINYGSGECNFMCQAAIGSAEHRLQPGVTMSYKPAFEGSFSFRTDPYRVQQILINLLTNACKHTQSGSILLECDVQESSGKVVFTVTDTGTGVPPEQAEAIFDRFTKLNEFVQGTGLGLSICRDIATRMGGNVFLDSTYTKGGARFVFELPLSSEQDKILTPQ